MAIPDATGNKRLDTLQNVIATGRAGLLFVIPGRTTTLRVNGRAVVSTRPELLSQLTAVGKPPASALVLGIQEVYPHCPKSLLRSAAWKPEQWLSADAQPTSAEVTLAQLRMPELTITDIEQAEADSLRTGTSNGLSGSWPRTRSLIAGRTGGVRRLGYGMTSAVPVGRFPD